MKRLLAILLIGIFAFNWFGYQLVTGWLQDRANHTLQTKLDHNNYDASSLFEVKFPLNLPYATSWSSFEKFEGEIEINNVHYNYVKRRVVNDTLILVCIPNEEKSRIRSAEQEYFKNINDLAANKKNDSKQHNSKAPLNDYLLRDEIPVNHFFISRPIQNGTYRDMISTAIITGKDRPPQI